MVIDRRTRVAIDTFGDANGAELLYAADGSERRYQGGPEIELPKGRYRFVFVGNGDARIALKRIPLSVG